MLCTLLIQICSAIDFGCRLCFDCQNLSFFMSYSFELVGLEQNLALFRRALVCAVVFCVRIIVVVGRSSIIIVTVTVDITHRHLKGPSQNLGSETKRRIKTKRRWSWFRGSVLCRKKRAWYDVAKIINF